MSMPLFEIISGVDKESIKRAKEMGVDYIDLHFNNREDSLLQAIDYCQSLGLKYVLNIEATPLDWTPSGQLRKRLENNSYFLGFMLDECDHIQLNTHWPVVDYYGYQGKHFFAETEGLDVINAQLAVGKGGLVNRILQEASMA